MKERTALAVRINGVESDTISVLDRGFQYGDGLFETIAVRAGKPRLWSRHLQRLQNGCRRLGLPQPEGEALTQEVNALCAGQSHAVLKLIISRGSGGRGYRPPHDVRPTRVLSLHPWPDYPARWAEEGVVVRLCRTPVSLNPALAGLKHLNRLDQVLARGEWDEPAIAEGIMLDPAGHVIEGTVSNLFLVKDGRLFTPDLSQCGVTGIMRQRVLEAAPGLGLDVTVTVITPADLATADEVFLTNSLAVLWPVRRLDQTVYGIGPVSRRLAAALHALID